MDGRRYSWSRDRVVPVLGARAGGPAERFAGRLHGRHPAAVFFAALLTGFAALALISIALGFLVTDVLLDIGELRRADNSFVSSLVEERTPFLTDTSEVFSTVGGAPLLPILVGLIALVAAALRQWRVAAFAAFALIVESATYRVTSLAVPRDRPHVHRLEDLPADASYPSGHTAAAIAVYAGTRVAADLAVSDSRSARLRLGVGDRDPCPRRLLPHVPRDAPSARHSRRARHRDRGAARAALCHPRGWRGQRDARRQGDQAHRRS